MRATRILLVFSLLPLVSICQQPELVLPTGHDKQVLDVVYSPNSKMIATTAEDFLVMVWDAVNGRALQSMEGHIGRVNTLEFSHNNLMLVSGSDDKQVLVWNISTGAPMFQVTVNDEVSLARFSTDDKQLLICTRKGKALLWNLETNKLAFLLSKGSDEASVLPFADTAAIRQAAFSKNGSYLFTQSRKGRVNLYNSRTATLIYQTQGLEENMFAFRAGNVKFNNDGSRLFLMRDGYFITFDPALKKERSMDFKFAEGILDFGEYSRDSLIAVDRSAQLISWKIDEPASVNVMNPGRQAFLYQAVFDRNCRQLLTAASDSLMETWDIPTMHVQSSNKVGSVLRLAISNDQNFFAVAELAKDPHVHHLPSGKTIASMKAHTNFINSVVLDTSRRRLYMSTRENRIDRWDLNTGRIDQSIKLAGQEEMKLRKSLNNKFLYTWYSNIVEVYDGESGKLAWRLGGGDKFNRATATFDLITDVEISPDEKTIAASSANHTIRLWDLKTGNQQRVITMGEWGLSQLRFSPDGKLITGQSALGILNSYNTSTGIFQDSLVTMAFSGRIFSSGRSAMICAEGRNGEVLVWDPASKKIRAHINLGKQKFQSASFSQDDALLAINTEFETLVWNMKLNKITHHFPQAEYSVFDAKFGPANEELYVQSADGTVHTYGLKDSKQTGKFNIGYGALVNFSETSPGWIVAANRSSVRLYNIDNDQVIQLTPIDSSGFIAKTDSGWYFASPDAARWLGWKQGDMFYDFDQWDLQYNRPDKILEALSTTDTSLLTAYRGAFLKRTRKMKLTPVSSIPGDPPVIELIEEKDHAHFVTSKNVQLKFRCIEKNPGTNISTVYVNVNGNPVYGMTGLKPGRPLQDSMLTISVELNEGINHIRISCANTSGLESAAIPVYYTYQPATEIHPRVYFIGIGISGYRDSANNLEYAEKDIGDIASLLKEKYPDSEVRLLIGKNATSQNIREMKSLLLQTKPDDRVIVAFSGHGLVDKNYDFYFATYDVDFDQPASKGLSFDDIEWLLDSIPSRYKLVLMDACHSGELDNEATYSPDSVIGDGVKETKGFGIRKSPGQLGLDNSFEMMQELFARIGKGNGATIISAAAGTELAYEGNNWRNGVFTYTILDGLKNLKADLDHDQQVSIEELSRYVSFKVSLLTGGKQKPTSRQVNYDNNWRLW